MRLSARVVAVIAAMGMTAMAAPASAQDVRQKFDAKVRVLSNGSQFQYHGRVRSNLEFCEVGRTVRISRGGREIVLTSTDERGRFSAKAAAVPDGSTIKFKVKPNEECDALKLFVEI